MSTLYSATRSVTFYVLADDDEAARALARELCPIDERPPGVAIESSAYRTPNQDADMKRLAVNWNF